MLPTRLRKNTAVRNLIRETQLSMNDVVYPLFIVDGQGVRKEIGSMKDQYHLSLDMLGAETLALKELGIRYVILFGVPDEKDGEATPAFVADGLVQEAIRVIKKVDPEMYVITDVCLCEYKSDGHCCFFEENGEIRRAQTLETLSKTALSHAEAGADMVAPSDMMDGRIDHMRETLDRAGYESIPIMAYSAKFASSFYGPFRDAANSAPAFGDRRSYQMDPANSREALKEMVLDIDEGADIVMVKPAMPYLDIIAQGKELSYLPMAAYQVSGEYAMIKNAVDANLMDRRAIFESLISIKRAGADIIITYFAKELQAMLKDYQ
ncbi:MULTISPECIES: porphobilinogen synthase [Acetobacterium]|jgi:porphobilinogen synthase|uniref:Delta-aminolevulinic acid dehydratase n=1 Tax=Acetobacterium wieringae TaxID=52694 RepID=A0A1F2PMU3_9FIRM|nr:MULTISPECIES: porphobilinogen synthase [Acetobacterium]MEA4804623.1 porphobilinogen synthase [Acetobacterium wieringae]OFV72265.1 delta-aminolevulinic acid dehydratase [Acetobacterium wieringae]OXS26983.1 MAG: delta-aminolevulinic acid dehydratase [Acetobacterium sp. MES1]